MNKHSESTAALTQQAWDTHTIRGSLKVMRNHYRRKPRQTSSEPNRWCSKNFFKGDLVCIHSSIPRHRINQIGRADKTSRGFILTWSERCNRIVTNWTNANVAWMWFSGFRFWLSAPSIRDGRYWMLLKFRWFFSFTGYWGQWSSSSS